MKLLAGNETAQLYESRRTSAFFNARESVVQHLDRLANQGGKSQVEAVK
jgi:hypothetical protein